MWQAPGLVGVATAGAAETATAARAIVTTRVKGLSFFFNISAVLSCWGAFAARLLQGGAQNDEKGVLAGELDAMGLECVCLDFGEEVFFGESLHLVPAIAVDCLVGRLHGGRQ
jgi:hypothetical protein